MNCSAWKTRATGSDGPREAIEAPGVPFLPGPGARAPLEGGQSSSQENFPPGKGSVCRLEYHFPEKWTWPAQCPECGRDPGLHSGQI
jgi:hypothetical protein